jgi:undecaprenyl-diphosphatase
MGDTHDRDWVRGAPSDVLHAAVAVAVLVLALVIGRLFDQTIVAAAAQVFQGLSTLPSWVLDVVSVTGTLLLLVLLGAGLVVAVTGRHWRLLASSALAAAISAGIAVVVNPAIDASEAVLPDSDLTLVDARVPSAALLAATTAIVVVTVTSLPRLWRRLAWLLVFVLLLLRVLGAPLSLDAVLAVLTGWAVGSLIVVVVGAPSRRPTSGSVLEGLAAVGVELVEIHPASVDARGSTPYFGATEQGARYFVKVLGGDERSADLMFRVWRFLQPRNLGDQRPFSSLRRGVEHEALVASMARQFGIRTPLVAGFATAHPNGYVLVYEAIDGRSLDQLEPDEMTDRVLDQAWAQLAELRRHRIAHRDLRLANVFLDADGELFLIDFGFSELAAEELLLQTDIAELLASSTSVVGIERALAAAHRGVGAAAVQDAAERLVPSRLSGATRASMKSSPGLLEQLRDAASATAPVTR